MNSLGTNVYRCPKTLLGNWVEERFKRELEANETGEEVQPNSTTGVSENHSSFVWPDPLASKDPKTRAGEANLAVPAIRGHSDRVTMAPDTVAGVPSEYPDSTANMLEWNVRDAKTNEITTFPFPKRVETMYNSTHIGSKGLK